MRIPAEEQDRLRSERGIAANEACDNCRTILGAVRYTRRGEPGEWCSETCRDGEAAVSERKTRAARHGLVRRKYSTVEERIAARRANANARQERFRGRQDMESPAVRS